MLTHTVLLLLKMMGLSVFADFPHQLKQADKAFHGVEAWQFRVQRFLNPLEAWDLRGKLLEAIFAQRCLDDGEGNDFAARVADQFLDETAEEGND